MLLLLLILWWCNPLLLPKNIIYNICHVQKLDEERHVPIVELKGVLCKDPTALNIHCPNVLVPTSQEWVSACIADTKRLGFHPQVVYWDDGLWEPMGERCMVKVVGGTWIVAQTSVSSRWWLVLFLQAIWFLSMWELCAGNKDKTAVAMYPTCVIHIVETNSQFPFLF